MSFYVLYAAIRDNMLRDREAWISALRAAGVKAAHPGDGWVNRKDNEVQFVFPHFNDGATVGDLVALGWPQGGDSKPRHRIVRLVGVRLTRFGELVWKFTPEEVSQ